LAKTIVVNV